MKQYSRTRAQWRAKRDLYQLDERAIARAARHYTIIQTARLLSQIWNSVIHNVCVKVKLD